MPVGWNIFAALIVMLSMEKMRVRWDCFSKWDFWPMIRLVIVAATLGFWIHGHFNWSFPSLAQLGRGTAELLIILWLCFFISVRLAEVILLILLFPLYAVVFLNDCFYRVGYLFFRFVFKFRSRPFCAGLALAGELGLSFLCLHLILAAFIYFRFGITQR
jgi:ABC-type multidrug transport system fused ATPase/permease subunit